MTNGHTLSRVRMYWIRTLPRGGMHADIQCILQCILYMCVYMCIYMWKVKNYRWSRLKLKTVSINVPEMSKNNLHIICQILCFFCWDHLLWQPICLVVVFTNPINWRFYHHKNETKETFKYERDLQKTNTRDTCKRQKARETCKKPREVHLLSLFLGQSVSAENLSSA